MISDPKLENTLYKQTTAFLRTYADLCVKFYVIADDNGSITPLCMILETKRKVLPLIDSL